MQAAVLTDYGDVDTLEVRDLPEPKPGRGELKIRMAAASINPLDLKLRSGSLKTWMPLKLPTILGFDGSGEVVELGAEASGFRVGDRVLGLVRHSHAQYAVAPPNALAAVPPGLDLRDAAAIPVVALTGVQLVEEGVAPKKGDVVLVIGALGGVGRAAVYAARTLGAKVIAGVRAKQVSEAKKLGAESVLALDDAAAVGRLPALDAIADTVGGEVTARLLPKLRPGGTVGSVVGEPPGAKDRGLTARAIQNHPDSKRLASLAQAVAAGELVLPIGARFPLAQVRDAHRSAEHGAAGKVLLTL
jgi:NADPH:quinone reductase-like Zn-dependent oxidoreductase